MVNFSGSAKRRCISVNQVAAGLVFVLTDGIDTSERSTRTHRVSPVDLD